MIRLLLVCLGGALGSGARYLVSSWALRALGPAFPFGTLAVNLAGSFLIALVMGAATAWGDPHPTARLTLTAGVLGGFTTYSAFSYETLHLFEQGAWATGVINLVATVLGGLLAALAGLLVGRWLA